MRGNLIPYGMGDYVQQVEDVQSRNTGDEGCSAKSLRRKKSPKSGVGIGKMTL